MNLVEARRWVAELLDQFTTREGGLVVMANRDYLAEVLVRELYLDEWFEQWGDPPDYLSGDDDGVDNQNAQKIRNQLWEANEGFGRALSALVEARDLARGDYQHNAAKLEDMVGAVRLLAAATGSEYSIWADYARERAKQAGTE